MSDLRERVARAIYETPPKEYPGWVGAPPELEPWEKVPDFIQRAFHDYADAAIALVLEQAAKVADASILPEPTLNMAGQAHNNTCKSLAAAIRALGKP